MTETVIVAWISLAGMVLVAVVNGISALLAAKYRKKREAREAADRATEDQWRKDELQFRVDQGQLLLCGGDLAYKTSMAHINYHSGDTDVIQAQQAYIEAKTVYVKTESELTQRYLQTGGMAS